MVKLANLYGKTLTPMAIMGQIEQLSYQYMRLTGDSVIVTVDSVQPVAIITGKHLSTPYTIGLN